MDTLDILKIQELAASLAAEQFHFAFFRVALDVKVNASFLTEFRAN
jgi:hypothetical protein